MLFDNSFDVFLFEQFLNEKRKLANTSIYLYLRTAEKFLTEGYNPLNIDDYNKYIIKHAIRQRSLYAYSVLKAFIEFKIDDIGTRTVMIEALIKPEVPKTVKREREYLDEKKIIELINNMDKMKHKIIALVQDLTGVRAGDVMRIKRGDIIPEIYDGVAVLKIIMDGKGQKRNVVYVHDEIVQMLIMNFIVQNYIDDNYYFIEDVKRIKDTTDIDRKKYQANYLRYYRDLKHAMYATGIDMKAFATHDYRRCYARRVWTKYKDLHVLQSLLNHVNPATTMGYLKQSGLQNVEYHKEMQSQ